MCTLRANLLKNPHRVEANQNHAWKRGSNYPRVPQSGKTDESVCDRFFRSVVGPGHHQCLAKLCSGPSAVHHRFGHVHQPWWCIEWDCVYHHQKKERPQL